MDIYRDIIQYLGVQDPTTRRTMEELADLLVALPKDAIKRRSMKST